MDDAHGLEEELLGPDYEYWKWINTPKEMGMKTDGSISTIAADVSGLINYVELLVSGGGKASKTGKPLGNKFFLKTGGQCKDIKTKKEVDRFMYINNVPTGNIPFLSSGMGVNFSDFEGLVPGILTDLNALNPITIIRGLMMGNDPDCQEITMETIDANNNIDKESKYVATVDIKALDPCLFPNKTNPVTKIKCRESFSPISQSTDTDVFLQLYNLGFGALLIYIVYRLLRKH